MIDGKRVKLQLWDTSGQGRFCTIIRSYSRGAQGILLVYDITNKWSFEGINRWLKEVDQVWQYIFIDYPKFLLSSRQLVVLYTILKLFLSACTRNTKSFSWQSIAFSVQATSSPRRGWRICRKKFYGLFRGVSASKF